MKASDAFTTIVEELTDHQFNCLREEIELVSDLLRNLATQREEK